MVNFFGSRWRGFTTKICSIGISCTLVAHVSSSSFTRSAMPKNASSVSNIGRYPDGCTLASRHSQVFPGHVQRWQNIIVPNAFIRGVHSHGDGDVRPGARVQSNQPARRTRAGFRCARHNTMDTRISTISRPSSSSVSRFQTAAAPEGVGNFLDDFGDDFRVTLPQPAGFPRRSYNQCRDHSQSAGRRSPMFQSDG